MILARFKLDQNATGWWYIAEIKVHIDGNDITNELENKQAPEGTDNIHTLDRAFDGNDQLYMHSDGPNNQNIITADFEFEHSGSTQISITLTNRHNSVPTRLQNNILSIEDRDGHLLAPIQIVDISNIGQTRTYNFTYKEPEPES